MYILLVEDDYLQSDQVLKDLAKEFPTARLEHIRTESAFRDSLDAIERDLPDVIVMDIMLRWADLRPDMKPAPESVRGEGFYKAGFRCVDLLLARERTKNIPIILFTALERNDIADDLANSPKNVEYMGKGCDIADLAGRIRNFRRQSLKVGE